MPRRRGHRVNILKDIVMIPAFWQPVCHRIGADQRKYRLSGQRMPPLALSRPRNAPQLPAPAARAT